MSAIRKAIISVDVLLDLMWLTRHEDDCTTGAQDCCTCGLIKLLRAAQSAIDDSAKLKGAAKYTADFENFWESSSKRGSKWLAAKAWKKVGAHKDPELAAAITEAHRRWMDSRQWREGFIPHVSTWLNRHGWEEEERPWQPPPEPEMDPETKAQYAAAKAKYVEKVQAERKAYKLKQMEARK